MKTKLKKNFHRMLPIGRVNYKCRDRDSRLEVSLGIPNCTAVLLLWKRGQRELMMQLDIFRTADHHIKEGLVHHMKECLVLALRVHEGHSVFAHL